MEQDINVIEGRIEAILFSVGEAVERERIAKALDMDTATVVKIIHNMMDKYDGVDRGVRFKQQAMEEAQPSFAPVKD